MNSAALFKPFNILRNFIKFHFTFQAHRFDVGGVQLSVRFYILNITGSFTLKQPVPSCKGK